MIEFKTERLILREITKEDYDVIRHLDIDPIVKKFIGPPSPEQVTNERMERIHKLNQDNSGLGYWMGETLNTGEPIGWFVLNFIKETELVEIGYRLKEEFWGLGYATEGSQKILEHGFTNVELQTIVGLTHLKNESSKKVLRKIGLIEEGVRYFYEQDVTFFNLSRELYFKNKSNG